MVFLSIESLCYCVGTGGTNTQRICDFLALSFMFSKFCPLITAKDICDLHLTLAVHGETHRIGYGGG